MKLETFFEKFDHFAEAPDAVAKMRELVLDIAQRRGDAENPISSSPRLRASAGGSFE